MVRKGILLLFYNTTNTNRHLSKVIPLIVGKMSTGSYLGSYLFGRHTAVCGKIWRFPNARILTHQVESKNACHRQDCIQIILCKPSSSTIAEFHLLGHLAYLNKAKIQRYAFCTSHYNTFIYNRLWERRFIPKLVL